MYRIELSGCFTFLLIFLFILFLLKEFWWVIAGIAVVIIAAYYLNLLYKTILDKKKEIETNYTPAMGEVYKVCPYCNAKVKVTASACPRCSRALN